MEKIVRVYYTSFIDVPCESENFSNEKEMVDISIPLRYD